MATKKPAKKPTRKPAKEPTRKPAKPAKKKTLAKMPTNERSGGALRLVEIDAALWDDVAKLFEQKGCPSYCWCMAWRATPDETKRTDRASRKAQLKLRVINDVPVGMLGYVDDDPLPVAWCSIAPRDTYRKLGGLDDGHGDDGVWSLVCMFLRRDHRGEGRAEELVKGALSLAKKHKARVVEAYPVDPDSPSYRFGGFVSMFARLGFVEVGRAGTRRHVMRHDLTAVRPLRSPR